MVFTTNGQTVVHAPSVVDRDTVNNWVRSLPNKFSAFGITRNGTTFNGTRDHALKMHKRSRKVLGKKRTNVEAVLYQEDE